MRNAPAYTQRGSRKICEKMFADGTETAKNAKVFYLESFPLYGSKDAHTRTQVVYTRTKRSILPGIDISALYNYNIMHGRSKSGIFKKKSGHRDIVSISGIIPEYPGWLAGMGLRWNWQRCTCIMPWAFH